MFKKRKHMIRWTFQKIEREKDREKEKTTLKIIYNSEKYKDVSEKKKSSPFWKWNKMIIGSGKLNEYGPEKLKNA